MTWDGRTARLSIRDVSPEDAGTYSLRTENEAGIAECWGKVNVLDINDPSNEDREPPTFERPLEDMDVLEGRPLELIARLQGIIIYNLTKIYT